MRDRNSSYFGSKYKSCTVRARCFGGVCRMLSLRRLRNSSRSRNLRRQTNWVSLWRLGSRSRSNLWRCRPSRQQSARRPPLEPRQHVAELACQANGLAHGQRRSDKSLLALPACKKSAIVCFPAVLWVWFELPMILRTRSGS